MPMQTSEYILDNANGTRKLWKCEIKCKYTTTDQATGFINRYLSINDETLKISNNKKCGEKSPYIRNCFDRCHHDTRYEKTRKLNLTKFKPNKRFKNTQCPFNLNFKIFKDILSDNYPCAIYFEHILNHPIKALHSFRFKLISDNVAASIRQLFQRSMTPSMAYYEFLQQLRANSMNELDFHIKNADRSICPRRGDFNTVY